MPETLLLYDGGWTRPEMAKTLERRILELREDETADLYRAFYLVEVQKSQISPKQ